MKYHKTKDGRLIKLTDLELSHLINIIKLIKKRAKEGITVTYGYSGFDAIDMWADQETLFGEEALIEMGYYHYISEIKRRINLEK